MFRAAEQQTSGSHVLVLGLPGSDAVMMAKNH